MSDKKKYSTIDYGSYLGLDKLLTAQKLRSEDLQETPAHDEMLFIITHQSYELWFKQIIHELESVITMFKTKRVDEKNLGTSIARLERVSEIQGLLLDHLSIMETMTPLDFLDFRNYLFPASGFQSFQFRKIENLLGLHEKDRLTYGNYHYSSPFSEEQRAELLGVKEKGNLFDVVEDWLERTPFLQFKDFKFLEYYREAVERMIAKEQEAIKMSSYLTEKEIEMRLKMLGSTDTYFESVLNPEVHETMMDEGKVRLSYKASLAALLINLYRDEPILHPPFKLLMCLVDIDSNMTSWRYRHAQMVLRMLGRKVGTGGSSGHDYLRKTAESHHIFSDLHNISTLLIPRSDLPELPPTLKEELSFTYTPPVV